MDKVLQALTLSDPDSLLTVSLWASGLIFLAALVIYCCVTNNPGTGGLKPHKQELMVFVGQEHEHGLTRSSHSD